MSSHEKTVVTLRDASLKDLDRLNKIENECFNEEAFTKEQISELLNDYNTVSLVAKVNADIAGFVIGLIQIERGSLRGHILTIDVDPAYRNKGIGTLMINEVENIFRQKLVRALFLEVREDNTPAIKLYSKLGYKIVGKLENYYGKTHGIYFRKTIS